MRILPAGWWITPALLGVPVGSALQLQQPALCSAWVYGAIAVAGVAITAWRGRWRALAVFLACAALAFSLAGLRSIAFQSDALATELEGRDLTLVGVVGAMPQRGEAGLRMRFEVESAMLAGEPVRVPPAIALGWYVNEGGAALPDLRAGDRWRLPVRLKAPHGTMNPHGFDYELWLWEQGLQATGYVRTASREGPQWLSATMRHPVERARQSVRDAIFAKVDDRRSAGILAALVAGDQAAIERADWDVFRATGVAHLMSISGLHITMFAWAAGLLARWAWRRSSRLCLAVPAPHAGLAGGVLLAAAYALFSGWGVPAQRTVTMLATVGALRFAGRRWPWPQVWLLAGAVVVAADPWALLQAGFWLSFVAVGVLFAALPAGERATATTRAGRAWSAVTGALREQWVVTIALAPLTLLLFGQVSLVGLVANAIAIPLVTLVVTPLAMAGVLLPVAWTLAAALVAQLAVLLQWLAGWPWATWGTAAAPAWAGVCGVIGGLLLVLRLPWPWRVLGLPLLLPVIAWQAARPPEGEFELLAADVGQGNAVLVRTASHTLVYDAGPRYGPESDAGHRVLVPLLRALDEKVDTLVLSHRDSDHTGGAVAVLKMQPEAALLSSIEPDHELQALRPAQRCQAGQSWRWDGVDFEVLQPLAADYDAPQRPNAVSCVLRISNGRARALLVGDIEAAQEARLVQTVPEALAADFLLVPHHGSKTSSTAAFLEAVHPAQAFVQAGYRNRFGHPAPAVVARYEALGVRPDASPHCGAATWRSQAPRDLACWRDASVRYWHHRALRPQPGPTAGR